MHVAMRSFKDQKQRKMTRLVEKLKVLHEVNRRMGIAAIGRLQSVKDSTIHFIMKNDEKISRSVNSALHRVRQFAVAPYKEMVKDIQKNIK